MPGWVRSKTREENHTSNVPAGRSQPTVPQVASLSDMLAVTPLDIVTKLKWIAIVIFSLFGLMHAGVALAMLRDRASARKRLKRLCGAEFGFREDGNAWTWDLRQDMMTEDMGLLSGTAVSVMAVRARTRTSGESL